MYFAGAADKCYVGGNQSQDADVHFKNDEGVTVLDMETRTVPQASGIRKNTQIRVVTVTQAGDTPLLASDWLVVISHDAIAGVTCTLPTNAAHGQIIVLKTVLTPLQAPQARTLLYTLTLFKAKQ